MSERIDHTGSGPDAIPERLGRYRLVRSISTGGMARVFEARRESLAGVSPKVALKLILPQHATDETFQQLFVNEARIGSQLQHQNLVQIQDFDREGAHFYLVMEYVEGITLRRAISLCKRNGIHIPLAVVSELGRQVCDGLHYAHTARGDDGVPLRLVHRDIKPSNMILNAQGIIKVLDFGISKALIAAERRGTVKGTWGYMGPEQAGGLDVTGTADQYGLAAVLYELAMLKPLFPEKEPKTLRHLMDQDEGARRASQLVGVHGPLAPVLVRALQRDPAARFPTCMAMSQALGRLIPDPIRAREQLLQFQSTLTSLDRARKGHHTERRPRSASTLSRVPSQASSQISRVSAVSQPASPPPRSSHPYEKGLPVAVGSAHRAYTASDHAARPPSALSHSQRGLSTGVIVGGGLILALLGLALVALVVQRGRLSEAVAEPVVEVDPPSGFDRVRADVDPAVTDAEIDAEAVRQAEAAEAKVAAEQKAANERAAEERAANDRAAEEKAELAAQNAAADKAAADKAAADKAAADKAAEKAAAASTSTASTTASSSTSAKDPGKLTISSFPRSKVIVDGRYIQHTPLLDYSVKAGGHTITLQTDDGRSTRFKVTVDSGGEVRRIWHFDRSEWVEK